MSEIIDGAKRLIMKAEDFDFQRFYAPATHRNWFHYYSDKLKNTWDHIYW